MAVGQASSRLRHLVAVGLAVAAAPATAATPVDRVLASVEALARRGELAAARGELAAAIDRVPAAERDDLRLRLCNLDERQGSAGRARDCYLEALPRLGEVEARASARYRAAALAVELGAREAAARELDAIVTTLASTAAAGRALRLRRALANDGGGVAAELDLLRTVAATLGEPGDVPARRLLTEVWVGVGQLELEERRDAGAAVTALRAAQGLARGDSAWDRATFLLGRALAAAGELAAALAAFHEIIREEEAAGALADPHDSELYDDTLFEIGVSLERGGRVGQARAAFRACLDKVPESVLADDAAFAMVRLSAEGDRRGEAAAFLARYPRSRHAAAARRLLETR